MIDTNSPKYLDHLSPNHLFKKKEKEKEKGKEKGKEV